MLLDFHSGYYSVGETEAEKLWDLFVLHTPNSQSNCQLLGALGLLTLTSLPPGLWEARSARQRASHFWGPLESLWPTAGEADACLLSSDWLP